MNGGAAAGGLAALVALVGLVLRIVITADRVDRSKARAQDARTRAALRRANAAQRPQPPLPHASERESPKVGYREPRPPINSPEALARFRDNTPPGLNIGKSKAQDAAKQRQSGDR